MLVGRFADSLSFLITFLNIRWIIQSHGCSRAMTPLGFYFTNRLPLSPYVMHDKPWSMKGHKFTRKSTSIRFQDYYKNHKRINIVNHAYSVRSPACCPLNDNLVKRWREISPEKPHHPGAVLSCRLETTCFLATVGSFYFQNSEQVCGSCRGAAKISLIETMYDSWRTDGRVGRR